MSRRAVVVLLAPLVVAPVLAAQRLSSNDRAQLVARIWSEAKYNFAGWDRVRADWDSALGAGLRAASQVQPDLLFYRRLRQMVALLGDAQTEVVAPSDLRSSLARPPIALSNVEGRPFITDYADNDEMRIARPQRLTEILDVQGVPAGDWIRDSILPEIGGATAAARWERAVTMMLAGRRGTLLHLHLRAPGGAERGASVTRSVSANDRWPLEPAPLTVDSLVDGVVVVTCASVGTPQVVEQFDRVFPSFAGVRGLILDLRHAAGGRPRHAYEILARLAAQPFVTVLARSPLYRPGVRLLAPGDSARSWYTAPIDTVAPPPRRGPKPYAGPIAVLASAATLGAAEDFLAAFRNTGRGVIIGGTSGGSPGEALDLPLGMEWTLRVTVTDEAFPDGVTFSGTGIAPELPATQGVDDFLAGRDAALELARSYVASREE